MILLFIVARDKLFLVNCDHRPRGLRQLHWPKELGSTAGQPDLKG